MRTPNGVGHSVSHTRRHHLAARHAPSVTVVLVDVADRAVEPDEVEDPDRAGERDLRVHRGVLQPSTPALLPRVRDTARLRPRPHPAGTHHHRKLAIESGNQAIGQVRLSPIRAADPSRQTHSASHVRCHLFRHQTRTLTQRPLPSAAGPRKQRVAPSCPTCAWRSISIQLVSLWVGV